MARILVVEDHEDSRVGLALWLQIIGHTVEASGDGLSALAVAQARPPAIAIIDISLPGLSGWDVAKRCAMRSDDASASLPSRACSPPRIAREASRRDSTCTS